MFYHEGLYIKHLLFTLVGFVASAEPDAATNDCFMQLGQIQIALKISKNGMHSIVLLRLKEGLYEKNIVKQNKPFWSVRNGRDLTNINSPNNH